MYTDKKTDTKNMQRQEDTDTKTRSYRDKRAQRHSNRHTYLVKKMYTKTDKTTKAQRHKHPRKMRPRASDQIPSETKRDISDTFRGQPGVTGDSGRERSCGCVYGCPCKSVGASGCPCKSVGARGCPYQCVCVCLSTWEPVDVRIKLYLPVGVRVRRGYQWVSA